MKKTTSRFLALALALILTLAMCGGALGEGAEAAKDTHILGGDEFPVRFDLREYGVVTPVKFQNPWSTCWSFGGIAAAESSILTTLGMTCEEYEKATGTPFDLSEKHLAWFASRPITAQTEESQVGEGLYFLNKEDDATAAYAVGGKGIFTTTLFAAGVGPVFEAYCPYRGAEGLTSVEFNEKHPDVARAYALAMVENEAGLTGQGMTLAQLYEKRSEMSDLFQMIMDILHRNEALDERCQERPVYLCRGRRLDDPRYRRKRQLQPRCLLRLYAGGRQYPASADGQRKRAMGRDQRGRHACGQVRAVEGARRVDRILRGSVAAYGRGQEGRLPESRYLGAVHG